LDEELTQFSACENPVGVIRSLNSTEWPDPISLTTVMDTMLKTMNDGWTGLN
jgi:hypothetical protein